MKERERKRKSSTNRIAFLLVSRLVNGASGHSAIRTVQWEQATDTA